MSDVLSFCPLHEQVSGVVSESANNRLYEGSQMSIKALKKSSNDSGTFSIRRQESHSPSNQ